MCLKNIFLIHGTILYSIKPIKLLNCVFGRLFLLLMDFFLIKKSTFNVDFK